MDPRFILKNRRNTHQTLSLAALWFSSHIHLFLCRKRQDKMRWGRVADLSVCASASQTQRIKFSGTHLLPVAAAIKWRNHILHRFSAVRQDPKACHRGEREDLHYYEELKKYKNTLRKKKEQYIQNQLTTIEESVNSNSFWENWNLLNNKNHEEITIQKGNTRKNHFEQLYSKINMSTEQAQIYKKIKAYRICNWQIPKSTRLPDHRKRADGENPGPANKKGKWTRQHPKLNAEKYES